MKQMLFTGFSPNTTMKDMWIAFSFLLLPWKWATWKKGKNIQVAENMISSYFGGREIETFDSGRSALLIALRALNLSEGDEVLVQAFTCVVVINAIKWAGATPIYVDIEKTTLNMSITDARRKNTSKTKVLIIQHTFGLPADIENLISFAKEKNLITIEDCAHSLGAKHKGRLIGTFADIGMLSFGGEKIISCVRGGALIINNTLFSDNIKKEKSRLPFPIRIHIFQHLFHVFIFPFGKKYYNIFLVKLLLQCLKILHITNRIITRNEKLGIKESGYPAKLPNALASLLISQIPTIDIRNIHRKSIAHEYDIALKNNSEYERQEYSEEHVYLRYPLFVKEPFVLRNKVKKDGIILGDWYSIVIGPSDTDITKTGYIQGMCPIAEDMAKRVINLPTNIHIRKKDAIQIISSINKNNVCI